MELLPEIEQSKALFLDRDGVVNVDRGQYVLCPKDLTIYQEIIPIARYMAQKGYLLIIITNQACVSRQLITNETLQKIHQIIFQKFKEEGIFLQTISYCPHYPVISKCFCRKPDRLQFERLLAKYNIKPEKSWMLGDQQRDLTPANALGIKTIHLGSDPQVKADFQVSNHQRVLDIMKKYA